MTSRIPQETKPEPEQQQQEERQKPNLKIVIFFTTIEPDTTKFYRGVTLQHQATAHDLKLLIEERDRHPVATQILSWKGRELSDGEVLRGVGVRDWDVIDFERV
jgi:hypothetical protein